MEQKSNTPEITGEDLELRIRKIKDLRSELAKLAETIYMGQDELDDIDSQLNELEYEFKSYFNDRPRENLAEKWLELWQKAGALEFILQEFKQKFQSTDAEYNKELNAFGAGGRHPLEEKADHLN